jgi:hypothetical protein
LYRRLYALGLYLMMRRSIVKMIIGSGAPGQLREIADSSRQRG